MDYSLVKNSVERKSIKGQWPLTRLLELFSELSRKDQEAEKKENYGLAALIASVVASFIFFFISKWMFLLGLLCIVVSLVFLWNYGRQNLGNEVRLFVTPLLSALKNDISDESPVYFSSDLKQLSARAHLVSKSKPYTSGAYYKCTDSLYQRDLLTLALPLTDGNRLLIRIKEALQNKSRRKKNARGKIKNKDRFRFSAVVSLRLFLNHRKYTLSETPYPDLSDLGITITGRKGRKGDILALKYRERTKGTGSTDNLVPDYKTLLERIARQYSFLIPVAPEKGGKNVVPI